VGKLAAGFLIDQARGHGMSEDRTQPPSKRRRQLAREAGQVAHSPELTAAAGWLVAVLALGLWGSELTEGLIGLVRGSLSADPVIRTDPAEFVASMRTAIASISVPLGAIVAAFAVGALVAHQLQVQGLWAPSLLAPDPGRLWTVGRGGGLGAGFERIAWAVIKAVLLASVFYWATRAEWEAIHQVSQHAFPAAANAAASAVLFPARVLGLVLLLLGLADYALRYFRFETMLQTTAQEQREDQRVMEGDVSLRSKRRRLARAWRGDAPELLACASLVLEGKAGLTVVLAGGPPPRRLTLRSVAQGSTGLQLRRTAGTLRVPQFDAPALALRLARQASAQPTMPTSLPAELAAEIAALWPAR